jgi:IS5 family transposase
MHQTRKGKQWYFGLKAHIGVDSKEGIVHFGMHVVTCPRKTLPVEAGVLS